MSFDSKLVFHGADFSATMNEQLWAFTIDELLENISKFGIKTEDVNVFCQSGKVSIVNSQSYLDSNFNLPIQPFFQVERGYFEHQGLGLGLYLCQQYVTYSNGRIQAFTDSKGDFIVDLVFDNR